MLLDGILAPMYFWQQRLKNGLKRRVGEYAGVVRFCTGYQIVEVESGGFS